MAFKMYAQPKNLSYFFDELVHDADYLVIGSKCIHDDMTLNVQELLLFTMSI